MKVITKEGVHLNADSLEWPLPHHRGEERPTVQWHDLEQTTVSGWLHVFPLPGIAELKTEDMSTSKKNIISL